MFDYAWRSMAEYGYNKEVIFMSTEIDLLTEIRDLLQVMAEPTLAKRDEKLREAVRTVAGRSQKNYSAIMLMDGSKTQSAIAKGVGMDPAQLNRLIKALQKSSLLAQDEKHPKLRLKLPPNFFDEKEKSNG
jgi:hypothetical protein